MAPFLVLASSVGGSAEKSPKMPEVELHKALEFPVAVATEIAASPFPFCANPPSFFSFFFIFFPKSPTASQSSAKGANRQRRTWGSVSDTCWDIILRDGIFKPGSVGAGQCSQTLGSLTFSPCCLWGLRQEDLNQFNQHGEK